MLSSETVLFSSSRQSWSARLSRGCRCRNLWRMPEQLEAVALTSPTVWLTAVEIICGSDLWWMCGYFLSVDTHSCG